MDIVSILTSNVIWTAFIVVIAWATRTWWTPWISEQIRGDVEERLEHVRSKLRESERRIETLREGAMENMKSAQAAVTERRLKAVDELWSGVDDWSKFNTTLMFAALIRNDIVLDGIKKGERETIEFAEQLLENAQTDAKGVGDGARASRPYVSDLAWALYTAYVSLFGYAIMFAKMFKPRDVGKAKYPTEGINDVLIKALPDMADYIKTSDGIGHYHLAEVLRTRILDELRSVLAGKVQDAESVERAALIQSAADNQMQKQAEAQAEASQHEATTRSA